MRHWPGGFRVPPPGRPVVTGTCEIDANPRRKFNSDPAPHRACPVMHVTVSSFWHQRLQFAMFLQLLGALHLDPPPDALPMDPTGGLPSLKRLLKLDPLAPKPSNAPGHPATVILLYWCTIFRDVVFCEIRCTVL